ncbi:MAG: ABC transporter ATP-binding protein [Candidatus Caldatribacteriota bacterium]
MSISNYILTVKRVSFSYHQQNKTLSDLNFSVPKGEFWGIIGPNGSGKTTLLKIICGILKPDQGKVYFEDQDLNTLPRREIAKIISVVPQDTWVSFNFKVKEIVFMGRLPYIDRWKGETLEDYRIAKETMKKTKSFPLAEKNIFQISGGERQRVFLAKALAQTPKLLLLDEFTSHLDLNYQYEMLKVLKNILYEERLTIISVFHDLNLASISSHRLLLLNQGRIERMGKPEEVLTSENLQRVYGMKPNLIRHPEFGVPQVLL